MSHLLSLFLPYLAHAENFTVKTGVPGPVNINEYGILGYIQNAYLLALGVAAALAIGSIIYGAVQYTASRGNPSKLSDAWDRIIQALVGILLLVGAGTLLSIVNPGLLSLELPKIEELDTPFSADAYTQKELEEGLVRIKANVSNPIYQAATGGRCSPLSAAQTPYCNPAALQAYGQANNCAHNGRVWDGTFMSIACRQESGGRTDARSQTDVCRNNGSNITFSAGLFQVNILNESRNPSSLFPACRGVMTPYTRSRGTPGCNGLDSSLGTCIAACKPVGSTRYCPLRNCGIAPGFTNAQYQACVASVLDPANNLRRACQLYRQSGLQPWAGTASHIAKNCR